MATQAERVSRYNAQNYAQNRERISAHRRRKYAQDREYRMRHKARVLKNQRRKPTKKRNKPITRSWAMPRVITLGKTQCLGYLFGDIVRMTGISRRKLEHWTEKEIIPIATFSAPNGWRMYSSYQVDLIVQALKECGIKPGERTSTEDSLRFKEIVHEGWTKTLSAEIGNTGRAKNGARGEGSGTARS